MHPAAARQQPARAPSFDTRDIRRSMDVYSADNVHLGVVLAVRAGRGAISQPALRVEEPSSAVNGELLGPMPTQTIGNSAPRTQSAATGFASSPDTAEPLGDGELVVGRWWGLAGRHTIPLDLIRVISMERIVLKVRADDLPGSMKQREHD